MPRLDPAVADVRRAVRAALAATPEGALVAAAVATRGRYVRPFLDLPRATTERACAALGLVPWHDPANDDRRHLRTRVRGLMPVLERDLGPGVAGALARTARLLRADADLLDRLAEDAYAETGLDPTKLATLPEALRTRVLRRAAIDAGCAPTDLTFGHVAALDALVTGWHGQGPVDLPGRLGALRQGGR